MKRVMTLLLLVALMPVLSIADPAGDAEVERLRKENAALRAEVTRLKERVAKLEAGRPAAEKAAAAAAPTRLTPQAVFALIPKEDGPDPTTTKWDDAKRAKARKILEAHLLGEVVRFDLAVREASPAEDKPWTVFAQAADVGPASVLVDYVFPERPAGVPRTFGRPMAVVGKVKAVIVSAAGGNRVTVSLTDCQLAK